MRHRRCHRDEMPLAVAARRAEIRRMASHHSARHPLFRQRWFADEVIITCVRWYLQFKLSYRDLSELARELGVRVAPCTILRSRGALRLGCRTMLESVRKGSGGFPALP